MTVPMIDLKTQFLEIRDEIHEILSEILESAHYILGPKVKDFEEKIAVYLGTREAIGVASGTDALYLALKSAGIKEGDEVITSPFTFFATAEAILYTGAKPVFVDIDEETMCIDVTRIESGISKKTRAILPVHIFGHPADNEKIMEIAEKFNLKVIEDCAQSFGAAIRGKKTGSFGDAGCFSFYPSKNLGAFGDGGIISINSTDMADRIRMLRNHGSRKTYMHECIGVNSRLDELQAGILLVKLKRIDRYNTLRREKASFYDLYLGNTVRKPSVREGVTHAFHQYTIRSSMRDKIKNVLAEHGIASVVYYPVPLHLQEALTFLGYQKGDFPVSEQVSDQVLSLPMYPELPEEIIKNISYIINNV